MGEKKISRKAKKEVIKRGLRTAAFRFSIGKFKMARTYSELITIPTFRERFEYLKLNGAVASETFGSARIFNQRFYASPEWLKVRRNVIVRDNGCDLAVPDHDIFTKILVHHIEPITLWDIEHLSDKLLDPENLICVCHDTHNAIHYGDWGLAGRNEIIERKPGDTKLW